MPQFRFNTISRADIERSQGGNTMIHAIDYDGSDHQLITGVPGSGTRISHYNSKKKY